MPDQFTPEKRRLIMSSIRSKNTGAERIVFSYLRKHKIYFQKHYKKALGTPDIALPRKKKAVFVDSAFWHGRKFDTLLKDRSPDDYWVKKIARNMERDRVQREELTSKGWKILVVWEDDIKRMRTRSEILARIEQFLTSP